MKKIVIALGAIALLASCQKSNLYTAGLYENGVVTFQADNSGEIPAFLEESGPVSFTFNSSVKADEDLTVNFEPVRDQAVLDAFNKAQGSKYQLLPEANINLSSNSTVIKAGNAVSEPVTAQVDIEGFENGVIYCLPLKIKGTSGSLVPIPGQEYAYLVIRGYVYASVAHLTGGYFSMFNTCNETVLRISRIFRIVVAKDPYSSSAILREFNIVVLQYVINISEGLHDVVSKV